MNCEQAAEFVSAFFDGEIIPPEAVEHISHCEMCGARMNEYAIVSAELRREASLNALTKSDRDFIRGNWREAERIRSPWYVNWKATMQIPRFVFAVMLILICSLAAGIAVVRARTGNGETALLLTFNLPKFSHLTHCVIRLEDGKPPEPCSFASYSTDVPGAIFANFRIVRSDGEKILLAGKVKFIETIEAAERYRFSSKEMDSLPEREVWLLVGESSQLPVSGLGNIELKGEFLDHVPTIPSKPLEALDPQKDEFRIVSPILIRDQTMILNMDGYIAISSGNNNPSVMLYAPNFGRFLLSAEPSPGAFEAKVKMNQIQFNEDGHEYVLANGMPITRAEHVWILHDPDFRPSASFTNASDENAMATSGSLSELLKIGKEEKK